MSLVNRLASDLERETGKQLSSIYLFFPGTYTPSETNELKFATAGEIVEKDDFEDSKRFDAYTYDMLLEQEGILFEDVYVVDNRYVLENRSVVPSRVIITWDDLLTVDISIKQDYALECDLIPRIGKTYRKKEKSIQRILQIYDLFAVPEIDEDMDENMDEYSIE